MRCGGDAEVMWQTCRLAAGLTLASWWGRVSMAGLSFSSWSSTKCSREVLRSVPFTSASFNKVSSLNPATGLGWLIVLCCACLLSAHRANMWHEQGTFSGDQGCNSIVFKDPNLRIHEGSQGLSMAALLICTAG